MVLHRFTQLYKKISCRLKERLLSPLKTFLVTRGSPLEDGHPYSTTYGPLKTNEGKMNVV